MPVFSLFLEFVSFIQDISVAPTDLAWAYVLFAYARLILAKAWRTRQE
jgi:hypothetical protein